MSRGAEEAVVDYLEQPSPSCPGDLQANPSQPERVIMSFEVARGKERHPITTLTEDITTTSQISADAAVVQAIARAQAKMPGIEGFEVEGVEVLLEGGNVAGYRVTLKVRYAEEAGLETEREPASIPIWSRRYSSASAPSAPASLPPWPNSVPLRTDKDGVVRVGGTRVALDSIVAALHSGETAEEIVEAYPVLLPEEVRPIINYYQSHQRAVDAYVSEREREAARLREEIEAEHDSTSLRARLLTRRAGER